jgi:PAS domain S-box-containing protein
MLIVQLVYNLAVLVAASVFSGFIDARWDRNTITGKILQGITFGLIAVVAMLNPFILTPGIIFDGRSIVLSLCSLFYGPVAGIIAGSMAFVTRIIIGGGGTIMGVSVIISSVTIGLLYYFARRNKRISLSNAQLYIFGIVVHVVMILLMSLLPGSFVKETLRTVGISVILFYPFATVLIGKILFDQENNYKLNRELRESEEKYRTLFNNDLAGNFITSISGNLILCNQAFARIFGFDSVDEIRNIKVSAFYKDQKQREEIIKNIQEHKKLENLELVLFNRHKKEVVVLANIIGEFDTSGNLLFLNGYIIDITDRKRAERLLMETHNRLTETMESISDGVVIFNKEMNYVFVNKRGAEMLGYKPEELIGKNYWQLFPEAKGTPFAEAYIKAMDTKQPIILEEYFEPWNRWFENRIYPASEGIAVYFSETTQRIHAEKMIKTLSNAVEQSPLAVIITDSKGRIEYVNRKFIENTQYTFEEIKDKIPVIFDKSRIDEEKYQQMWDELNHGNVWIGEYLNQRKDGTSIWEEVTVAPIYINNNLLNNYVIITENITDKKKILEELIAAKEKAEESDRLKSAFLANMSHEIRTPMNSILGFTGLLKKPDLSDLKKEKYVELIEKSGQRMLNTLNDLINISRIEAGEVKVYFTNININKLLNELRDFFRNEAQLKGIKLNVHPALKEEEAIINTDDVKLHAVLTNLIKNALKFTHSGSIDFGYWINEKEITFFVRDTGKGISQEFQKKLFQRFVQEESGYTRMYEGSGLGLSISKAYIDMLGGKIWLEHSTLNKGSEFRFTIPYIKGSEEIINHDSGDKTQMLLSTRKINILIAEDDDVVFEYLSIILGDICKKISRAKTGIEAMDIFKNSDSFDLILMDIKLPLMDGLTAARKMRELDDKVVIIAQTAFAFNEDRQKALDAGCNDYISKPIKPEVLLEKVRKLLQL